MLKLRINSCINGVFLEDLTKICGVNSEIAKFSSLASLRPLRLLSNLVFEDPGELAVSTSQSAHSKPWRANGRAEHLRTTQAY